MTHGPATPIPHPLPLLVDEGRTPHPLLTAADVEAASPEARQAFALAIGAVGGAESTPPSALASLAHLYRRGLARGPELTVHDRDVSGEQRRFRGLAPLALWASYSLGASDFMVATSRLGDVAEAVKLAKWREPYGALPADAVLANLGRLHAPAYYGLHSAESGTSLLRFYVGREGGFALHVLFEAVQGGALMLAGEPDANGVPPSYARLSRLHVQHAVKLFAEATGAEMASGHTEEGSSFRLNWE